MRRALSYLPRGRRGFRQDRSRISFLLLLLCLPGGVCFRKKNMLEPVGLGGTIAALFFCGV